MALNNVKTLGSRHACQISMDLNLHRRHICCQVCLEGLLEHDACMQIQLRHDTIMLSYLTESKTIS